MLKLGTIGTSWITQAFIDSARQAGGIKINACYSRDENRAKEFAKKNGAEFYFCEPEKMASCGAVDAVYIASPNALHYEQSKLFLENGRHVLVEKPATTTKEQSEELFALAEKNGLVYAEAIMSVHTPQFGLLKKELEELGRLRTVNLVFCQLSSKYGLYLDGKNPNIFNPRLHTGCLMDIGVYNVYIAAALFGKPDAITSCAVFLDSGADACGTAVLRYGDMTVNLIYSKVGQSYSPSEFIGDKASLSVDSISQLTGIDRVTKDGRINLAAYDIPRSTVMSGEAAFFRDTVAGGTKNNADYDFAGRTALTVREICDEIRRQNHFPF